MTGQIRRVNPARAVTKGRSGWAELEDFENKPFPTGSLPLREAPPDRYDYATILMISTVETVYILSQHTDRSLIILDEIGRGTSTYDGLSIAWAVVEHLHRGPERGPRTLFATHYQELTQLEKHLPRMRNFPVAVKEWNEDIVFVRRVIPGAADLATVFRSLVSPAYPAPQAKPKKKTTVAPTDDSQLSLL